MATTRVISYDPVMTTTVISYNMVTTLTDNSKLLSCLIHGLQEVAKWQWYDIGHGYYGPETGDRVQESNPGLTKRSCCKVRESNPGPTNKIMCKAKGSNLGPTKKIVCTIMHTIAKYDCAYDRKN